MTLSKWIAVSVVAAAFASLVLHGQQAVRTASPQVASIGQPLNSSIVLGLAAGNIVAGPGRIHALPGDTDTLYCNDIGPNGVMLSVQNLGDTGLQFTSGGAVLLTVNAGTSAAGSINVNQDATLDWEGLGTGTEVSFLWSIRVL